MKLIHLVGTMCSGKTWAHKDLNVARWDLQQFYIDNGCYTYNGNMNWNRWNKTIHKIKEEIHSFIEKNKNKRLGIIETAGNTTVYETLNEIPHSRIELTTPSRTQLQIRATQRKEPEQKVLEFAKKYNELYADPTKAVTPQEARVAIKGMLNSNINIGIIGSAGRGEDNERWNKKVYINCFNKLLEYINNLGLESKELTLVSGGAAWADHLAVSCHLSKRCKELNLFFPAAFMLPECEFQSMFNAVGGTANYYHRAFSQKMGGNTLQGISKVIERGAKFESFNGFKKRNLEIAKNSDILVAFTFNNSNTPKPNSGTLHTWNNCKGVRRHFNIASLYDRI